MRFFKEPEDSFPPIRRRRQLDPQVEAAMRFLGSLEIGEVGAVDPETKDEDEITKLRGKIVYAAKARGIRVESRYAKERRRLVFRRVA